MEERKFAMINLTLCTLVLIINLFASFIIWKRRPLKPFRLIMLNIVLINALYALNEMSTYALDLTPSSRKILSNRKFCSFVVLKASLIVHIICLFIVLIALHRFIAVIKPLKYATYVTTRKTVVRLVIIYSFGGAVFLVCSVIIWKTDTDYSKIHMTLSCSFILEGVFIIGCYTLIICKLGYSRINRSSINSSPNSAVLKLAVIVSISFLLSYTPIAFVFILDVRSHRIFHIVLLMVWIDSFINPIIIILDIYNVLDLINRTLERVLLKNKISPGNTGSEDHAI